MRDYNDVEGLKSTVAAARGERLLTGRLNKVLL